MLVVKHCIVCQKRFEFNLTSKQLEKIRTGDGYIQDILPDLTPAEREMFLSGFCGECWKDMISTNEDKEEY